MAAKESQTSVQYFVKSLRFLESMKGIWSEQEIQLTCCQYNPLRVACFTFPWCGLVESNIQLSNINGEELCSLLRLHINFWHSYCAKSSDLTDCHYLQHAHLTNMDAYSKIAEHQSHISWVFLMCGSIFSISSFPYSFWWDKWFYARDQKFRAWLWCYNHQITWQITWLWVEGWNQQWLAARVKETK